MEYNVHKPLEGGIQLDSELRWLTKKYKSLPSPKLVIDSFSSGDFNGFVGMYIPPGSSDYINSNYELIKNVSGLILVDEDSLDLDYLATVAHEFRHHWQYCKNFNMDGYQPYSWYTSMMKNLPKWRSLVVYSSSDIELDALEFELKMWPTEDRHVIYKACLDYRSKFNKFLRTF